MYMWMDNYNSIFISYERCVQRRAQLVAHPAQPREHLVRVGAEAEHLAQALVERAVGRALDAALRVRGGGGVSA